MYRNEPCPYLSYTDHISIVLIPAYILLIRHAKQTKTWSPGAISAHQGCFEHTDWDIFREAAILSGFMNLEEFMALETG